MTYSWNYAASSLSDWLPSLSSESLSFSHVFSWLVAHLLWALNYTTLSGCTTTYCLSITYQRTSWLLLTFDSYKGSPKGGVISRPLLPVLLHQILPHNPLKSIHPSGTLCPAHPMGEVSRNQIGDRSSLWGVPGRRPLLVPRVGR